MRFMSRISIPILISIFVPAVVPVTASCSYGVEPQTHGTDELTAQAYVPARGGASTLDVGTWNIEWFGHNSLGPGNEALQLDNVRDVISGADLDIWGVEEIVDTQHFNDLLDELPGYDGLLANASNVTDGSYYYGYSEQKVGVIYKSSMVSVQGARIILTAHDYDFAGRPPLEVHMQVTLNGATSDLFVIVLHAKASTSSSSWQRRKDGADALKSYLDTSRATDSVIVIGDYNDDVDTSISWGKDSPYKGFVLDSADYRFPTEALSHAGVSSTVSYSDMIDHHLVTNELEGGYLAGSAEVYRVDEYISRYSSTTSDHYPVLTRYEWGGEARVILNEILANEPGGDTAHEFIELVNVGGASADISGWTLSDSGGVRHTFAGGTTLGAGRAIVVFGGASAVPWYLDNAVAASTGTLSLRNSGESVSLKDAGGDSQDWYSYPGELAAEDGVSMNRDPDGDGDAGFVLHTVLSGSDSSAGTRAGGSDW